MSHYNLGMLKSDPALEKQQVFILLPSAVEPPSLTPYLVLRDKSTRFQQTIKALAFWSKLQKLDFYDIKVVIGDNTGWSERLFQKAKHRYQEGKLISIEVPQPDDEVILRGKGAAETEALIHMLKSVEIFDDAIIIKMTARQYCVNAIDLLYRFPQTAEFSAWPRQFLESIDSRFFIARAGYLRTMLPKIASEANDLNGVFVENLYAKYCIWGNKNGYARFDHEPGILGQAGTTGTQLSILSEAVLVGYLVNFRRFLRTRLSWIQPKYARR
jgi:hypothetical protein